MATIRWTGKSVAVAQVDDGSITAYDAASTYKITINGVEVSSTAAGSANLAAAALVAAAGASTHPYFSSVSWSNPSAANITATAGTAGVPFTATLSVTGGTGTVSNFSNTTASSGPNHWDDADNWEGGVLPGAGDDVVIENSDSQINYGLDTITAALTSITVLRTFTGRIGLDSVKFSLGGTVTSADAVEYREDYLKVDVTTINLGQQIGPGTPAGSARIKINNTKAGASTLTVHGTANAASESFLPAVRYVAANASADVTVLSAPGGVGVGKDFNGETATVGDITFRAQNASDRMYVGSGVTYTNYEQFGGQAIIDAAATVTAVDVSGGSLEMNGDYTVTTLNNDGGEIVDNHLKSAGNAITTLNNNSGTFDLNQSNDARTVATLNQGRDATLIIDPNVVTVTTFNRPSDPYQMETSTV